MIVGLTGTRDGLSNLQLSWLYSTFESGQVTVLHHGACVGADEAAHAAALENDIRIEVWPPVLIKYRAAQCISPHPLVKVHPNMPYLDRDRQIVGHTTGLIALPKQNSQPGKNQWGGTWYTVDFAERMGKPVTICYPNGQVEQRHPMQAA